jgi:hypothetical protein
MFGRSKRADGFRPLGQEGAAPFLDEMIRKLEEGAEPTYKEHMALRSLPREQRSVYGEAWRRKFPDEEAPPWLP